MMKTEIDEAFRTADKITFDLDRDDEKCNLYIEWLSPASASNIAEYLEHLRPGFIKENHLVHVLGSFGSDSHSKD